MNRHRQSILYLLIALTFAPALFSRGRVSFIPEGRIRLLHASHDSLPTATLPFNPYARVDSLTLAAPREAERSVHTLAAHFKRTFSTHEELLRAFYVWTTHRISYNMYSTFTSRNEVFNPEEQLAELFQTRKGVCSHYVLLFYTLCQECGVRCHTVHGYNKQGKRLMTNTHEWCVVLLDDEWYALRPLVAAEREAHLLPRIRQRRDRLLDAEAPFCLA